MKCPYCGKSDCVANMGVPTAAKLIVYAVPLGLGVLPMAMAGAMELAYRVSGKRIYKCNRCGKYFIA